MTNTREALIRCNDPEKVARFLPNNYTVVGFNSETVTVRGQDHYGWTLDGYVLPRLASGLIFGEELPHIAGDCSDMGCKWHGVAAVNRNTSDFYTRNPR